MAAESLGGPLSVLANNAGVTRRTLLADKTVQVWSTVLDINLTGTFLAIKAVAPSMRRAGAIVNVSSMSGLMAIQPSWAYTASEWGVRGLTEAAALELGGEGVTVNSIHPGFISTAMNDGADKSALSADLPLSRAGTVNEVADLVQHLVADATYSTGSEFSIDGGMRAGIRPGAQ